MVSTGPAGSRPKPAHSAAPAALRGQGCPARHPWQPISWPPDRAPHRKSHDRDIYSQHTLLQWDPLPRIQRRQPLTTCSAYPWRHLQTRGSFGRRLILCSTLQWSAGRLGLRWLGWISVCSISKLVCQPVLCLDTLSTRFFHGKYV